MRHVITEIEIDSLLDRLQEELDQINNTNGTNGFYSLPLDSYDKRARLCKVITQWLRGDVPVTFKIEVVSTEWEAEYEG